MLSDFEDEIDTVKELAVGTRVASYEIIGKLGAGGMGVVYKAWEESLQRFVAIKMLGDQLTHDDSIVQRFLREARAVADGAQRTVA